MAIDIVDIRGKKFAFIDELAGKRRLDVRTIIVISGISIEVPNTEKIIREIENYPEYNDTDSLVHILNRCSF